MDGHGHGFWLCFSARTGWVWGDGDDGMPEWDDDDLVAMQAEPMVTFHYHCNVQTSQQGLGKASSALSARKRSRFCLHTHLTH